MRSVISCRSRSSCRMSARSMSSPDRMPAWSAGEILVQRAVELADADFLVVAEIDEAVLRDLHPVLDIGEIRHVLIEHVAEHAEFRRRGPGLVLAQELHLDAMCL